jgi:hypothetical protein
MSVTFFAVTYQVDDIARHNVSAALKITAGQVLLFISEFENHFGNLRSQSHLWVHIVNVSC